MSFLGSIVGDAISGITSFIGGSQANDDAHDLAFNQMDFQREMSSTAYRRATEDMKKAGLNPILAAGASPASTPSGASAPVMNTMEGLSSAAGRMSSNALSNLRLKEEVVAVKNQAAKTKSEDFLAQYMSLTEREKAENLRQTNAKMRTETALLNAQLPAAMAEAALYDNKYGKALAGLSKGLNLGASAVSSAKGLKDLLSPQPPSYWQSLMKGK